MEKDLENSGKDEEILEVKKPSKKRPRESRKFMCTQNLPEDCLEQCVKPETFALLWKRWKEKTPDLRYICGGLERGDTGNLHYQLYFETEDKHSVSALLNPRGEGESLAGFVHKVQTCYAPVSAKNYSIKADHTLVAGPWEMGNQKDQGKRSDLQDVYDKVKLGETYESMMCKGEHLMTLARFPKFVRQLEVTLDSEETTDEWPLIFEKHSMDKPDPAKKQRHWWISGPPDWGKSYKMEEALGNRPVFYTKGSNKNRMEGYKAQEIIVFDDCVMTFEELAMYTDTHKYGLPIPQRNVDGWLKRKSCRNVIVISNKTIDEIGFKNTAGVKARFIEIKVGDAPKLVQPGYVYEPKGYIM